MSVLDPQRPRIARSCDVSQTLTIPAGATDSGTLSVAEWALGSLIAPAELTGSEITFLVSHDGETFVVAVDSNGTAITRAFASGGCCSVPPEVFDYPLARVRGNAAEAAERTISVALKG